MYEIARIQPNFTLLNDQVKNKLWMHGHKGKIFPLPLDGFIYVETANLQYITYFLNYFIGYFKPVLLISDQQCGKTAFLRKKIKDLHEDIKYTPV